MRKIGDHAVVLGASMGGLLAARVLADAYQRVTIVDRDLLPERAADRQGVPQGRHAHALLARGAQILEELFPGLLRRPGGGGCAGARQSRGSSGSSVGGHLLCQDGEPRRPGLPGRAGRIWKPRSAAGSGPWTTSRSGTGARWPGWSPRRPATGSPASACGPRGGGRGRYLAADLVVDATGRGGRTAAWLKEIGYDPPRRGAASGSTSSTPAGTCGCAPARSGTQKLVLIGAEPGPGPPPWRCSPRSTTAGS